jgi:hypothetical protein
MNKKEVTNYTIKTTNHGRKKSMKTSEDGRRSHTHGLTEMIL